MKRSWYPLDHAATLYPGVISGASTGVFRIAARLSFTPELQVVQEALHKALPYFPFFTVRLRRGLFWHFLERIPGEPSVQWEVSAPCRPFREERDGPFLFRILLYHHRISLEISHLLTDGHGALEFLRTILDLVQSPGLSFEGLQLPPLAEAASDAYQISREKKKRPLPPPKKISRAWQYPGDRMPRGMLRYTRLRLPSETFLPIARQLNVTFTEWLAAVVIEQLIVEQQSHKTPSNLPIRLLVPVNLRPILSSRSLRNVFQAVLVGIDPRLGPWSFDEILSEVHHRFRIARSQRHLQPLFTRTLRSQNHPILRAVPSTIKDYALRALHRSRSSRRHTALLSNLGPISWNSPGAEIVNSLEMIPNPNPVTGLQLSVIGWKDHLVLSCVSLCTTPQFERRLIQRLQQYDTHLELETNWC